MITMNVHLQNVHTHDGCIHINVANNVIIVKSAQPNIEVRVKFKARVRVRVVRVRELELSLRLGLGLGLGYSVITSIKVYILHHSLKVRVKIGRVGKYIA